MVYSNWWLVVGAKRYGRSNVVPLSRCDWVAHLSDSLSRSVQLRRKNGNSHSKAKSKSFASITALCARYLATDLKLALKDRIPPRSSRILENLNHFSASVHLISTESPEYIVKWPHITLTNAVVWRGVSCAHGTAITTNFNYLNTFAWHIQDQNCQLRDFVQNKI